jgi:hypothetical protein
MSYIYGAKMRGKNMNLFQLFHRSKTGERHVRYIVKGDADSYNITYKFGRESQVIQEPHIPKGWKHTFVGHDGDYVYIAAQSNKPGSAVNVVVYEDGKLIEKVTKTGDYPIVQFSGEVHHLKRPQ